VDHVPEIRQFSHGQSNPTYLVDLGPNKRKLVLRKKPPGKLLPSAHAVEREFRLLVAFESFSDKKLSAYYLGFFSSYCFILY